MKNRPERTWWRDLGWARTLTQAVSHDHMIVLWPREKVNDGDNARLHASAVFSSLQRAPRMERSVSCSITFDYPLRLLALCR